VVDQFTYTVTDNSGSASTATATVTIHGENDAPVAVDDSYIATPNPLGFGASVLVAPDGQPLGTPTTATPMAMR
jgi:Bacterial cadherin-like domain